MCVAEDFGLMLVPFVSVQVGARHLDIQHGVVFFDSEATVAARTRSVPVVFASMRLVGMDDPKPGQFSF
jgi:hypothetical protein